MVLTTDLPLAVDRPIDFGLQEALEPDRTAALKAYASAESPAAARQRHTQR